MLKPTKIYSSSVLEMMDVCDVHGIAHITGGAFSKINRLNKNIGYRIDKLPEPAPIFKALWDKVEDFQEMHRTFNMGVGMVVVIPEDAEGTVLNIAKKHDLNVNVIGEVTDKKGIWLNDGSKSVDMSIKE